MGQNHQNVHVIPQLIERRCGGWLAVTPQGFPLGIGVTADTMADAESKFRDEMNRIARIKDKRDS